MNYENLKQKISNAGIKQTKVAEKIGVTPEYLSLMLNGKASMSEKVRNSITDLLSKVEL